jgi:hypothetical protein
LVTSKEGSLDPRRFRFAAEFVKKTPFHRGIIISALILRRSLKATVSKEDPGNAGKTSTFSNHSHQEQDEKGDTSRDQERACTADPVREEKEH